MPGNTSHSSLLLSQGILLKGPFSSDQAANKKVIIKLSFYYALDFYVVLGDIRGKSSDSSWSVADT